MEKNQSVTRKPHNRRASAATPRDCTTQHSTYHLLPSLSLFSRPIPPLNPITLTSTPVHRALPANPTQQRQPLPKPTNPIASQSRALNPSCHALASPHPPIPSPATNRGHIDSSPRRCHSTSQLVSRRRLQWLSGRIPARNKPLDMHCPAFRVPIFTDRVRLLCCFCRW
jgi:hypothetical protein